MFGVAVNEVHVLLFIGKVFRQVDADPSGPYDCDVHGLWAKGVLQALAEWEVRLPFNIAVIMSVNRRRLRVWISEATGDGILWEG